MKRVDERDGVQTAGIRAHILHGLRTWRLRLLWQRVLYTAAALALTALAAQFFDAPVSTLSMLCAALVLASLLQLRLGPAWRRSNPGNFLEHLNRRFPDFEESAGLLLADENGLTAMQNLQRGRVLRVYRQNLARVERWRNPVRYRAVVAVISASLILGIFSQDIRSLATRLGNEASTVHGEHAGDRQSGGLNVVSVSIQPPAYTGLEAAQTRQLDIELPEGSRVEWVLDIDGRDAGYALRLSGGEELPLERGDDGHLHASGVIVRTDLYRIVATGSGGEETIGGIHSLTVDLDHPPDIRIIEPQLSVLEIPKSGSAHFESQALVRDDYGLQDVEILASVAKGSGEGVKFRDQSLQFDRAEETGNGRIYGKDWDLEALGMEPGDEVYFTVIATDNRLPQANTGRSETLIVRWLDEDQGGLAAEGLGIDFIPEFFKSQRQIIIDTEQLIADRPQLALQHFKDTSYGIGRAQADLKEKYGQYLGDEFGEGPGDQLGGAHEPAGEAGDDDDHDHHETAPRAGTNRTLTNTADIIRLYGHNHGDPEIGPITRRNPVALMKRAVSEMWQAERHLMQAEPDEALPFEYEAYKYLKLARQADRIYVKRLGFEPPPVSEDNRLQGKLDEIRSYRLTSPDAGSNMTRQPADQLLLKKVYQLLGRYSSESELNDGERELLHHLGGKFTLWSQQNSALIRHAATLEKLALEANPDTDSCKTCRKELESAIWNLIDAGDAQFHHRATARYDDDGLVGDYLDARGYVEPTGGPGGQR